MRVQDGPRAWQVLRLLPAYRRAWNRRLPQPGLPEAAPFPIRLQTADDLAAERFGLYAWENPFARNGPASPFRRVAPMLPAAAGPRATPLAGAAADGLSVAGLRLVDGSLVVELEWGAAMSGRQGRTGAPRGVYQRAVMRNPAPCCGAPLSLAGSRRVASRLSSSAVLSLCARPRRQPSV